MMKCLHAYCGMPQGREPFGTHWPDTELPGQIKYLLGDDVAVDLRGAGCYRPAAKHEHACGILSV